MLKLSLTVNGEDLGFIEIINDRQAPHDAPVQTYRAKRYFPRGGCADYAPQAGTVIHFEHVASAGAWKCAEHALRAFDIDSRRRRDGTPNPHAARS